MPENAITTLWNAARLVQTALNQHLACRHEGCQKAGRCTGGPRGTCRKTGGFPACHTEGRRRLKEFPARHKWQAEPSHAHETPAARQQRHMEHMTNRMKMDAILTQARQLTGKAPDSPND